ncbi:MAG: prolipoprotein diacylglyceryl transferase [Planctomycetota bacterium]
MWPVLFEIPLPFASDGLAVRGFGAVFLVGVVLAHRTARAELARRGVDRAAALDLLLATALLFALGSRLAWYARELARGAEPPLGALWSASEAGLDYWGGFFAAALGLPLWLRRRGIPVAAGLDAAALGASLAAAVVRLGSLLDGGYRGMPTDAAHPLRIRFPTRIESGSFLGFEAPPDNGNLAGVDQGQWLHPAALYAAVAFLAVHLVLRWRRRRREGWGELAALYAIGIGLASFAVGFWRGDIERDLGPGISWPQAEALGAAALGAIALFRVSGPRSS